MSKEDLERADEESKRREVEEAMRRAEEGNWSEVQRIAADIFPQKDGDQTFGGQAASGGRGTAGYQATIVQG